MPIYEYECLKCKAHVEIMQKISDKPLSKCSKCGGRLEKQWSSTSFQLKGSGWYVTDYAAKKGETKESKPASTEETSKGEAKEDKSSKKDSPSVGDKATPKEPSTSKKSGSSKTAPSSGD